jgi:transposase
MEACCGAHKWARRFAAFGHRVKLMAPKCVAPYRKGGKNDGNDAEAICEAVTRPNMRFVPIKSIEQQSDLTLHRVRQGFVEERTATLNRIRGLLAEFGQVLPLRAAEVGRRVPELLETLPTRAASCVRDLLEHAMRLETKALEYEREIRSHVRTNALAQRAQTRLGIGRSIAATRTVITSKHTQSSAITIRGCSKASTIRTTLAPLTSAIDTMRFTLSNPHLAADSNVAPVDTSLMLIRVRSILA